MDYKLIYEKNILRFLSSFCLSVCAALYLNAELNTGLSGIVLFLAVLLFNGFFACLDFIRKNFIFYAGLLLFAGIISGLVILTGLPVADSFHWLLFSRNADAELALTYSLISQIILFFPLTGIMFGLLGYGYVRTASGAALFIFCIVMAALERDAEFIIILLIFTFIFIALHERLIELKTALPRLLPFFLIAGLLTAVLPSEREPLQWNTVKNVIRSAHGFVVNINERIALMFSSDGYEFGINMTGYSGSGNIAGAITLSEKRALLITEYKNAPPYIYLTGNVMDIYTGNSWSRENNLDRFSLPEYRLDNLELLLAFYHNGIFDLSSEERDEIFTVREIGISYLDIKTRSLFYPRVLLDTRIPLSYRPDTSGMSMMFDIISGPRNNITYRVAYLDLNYGNPEVARLLENNSIPETDVNINELYTIMREYFPSAAFWSIPQNYKELLSRRRVAVYDTFTALPDTVPERVYALSLEITEPFDNNYAKMQAIEKFLTANYSYTRSPRVIPDDSADFTDSFLFEIREGFCTYFATAAAVLGRAAGIPVRYVQGYVSAAEDGARIIRERSAHAWVEAYVDGVGWIAFEPSPAFSGARYGEWVAVSSERPPPVSQPQRDLHSRPSSVNNPADGDNSDELQNNERRNVYTFAFIICGIIILTAFGAVLTGFLVSLRRFKKRYLNSPPNVRFLSDYKSVLLLLEFTELSEKPLPCETASQIAEKLCDPIFIEITATFEKIKYGGKDITSDEVKIVADYKEKLLKQTEKRLGKIKYLLYLTRLLK